MKFSFISMLNALSYALDEVESELIGSKKGHGKRVAYITNLLGKEYNLNDNELEELYILSIMHDNALTEYAYEERDRSVKNLGIHCIIGEENIKNLSLLSKDAILYHHENYDGTGLFKIKGNDIPLFARLIKFADILDLTQVFLDNDKNFNYLIEYIDSKSNSWFDPVIVEKFKKTFNIIKFNKLKYKGIDNILKEEYQSLEIEKDFNEIRRYVDLFAKIVDYKSVFTKNHSLGVANKAYLLGKQYGFCNETLEKLYIAGAFHDLGKMGISNKILEKPDKLTDIEYSKMKNHAYLTFKILKEINGFGEITKIASRHHEHLDGSGYPFSLEETDLDMYDRILAVIDIYQALSEDRPYKKGLKHDIITKIMKDMVDKHYIDGRITYDCLNYNFKGVINEEK